MLTTSWSKSYLSLIIHFSANLKVIDVHHYRRYSPFLALFLLSISHLKITSLETNVYSPKARDRLSIWLLCAFQSDTTLSQLSTLLIIPLTRSLSRTACGSEPTNVAMRATGSAANLSRKV